jgi:hypothetical protein
MSIVEIASSHRPRKRQRIRAVRRPKQKSLVIAFVVGLALLAISQTNPGRFQPPAEQPPRSDQRLIDAIENRQSDVQVRGSGTVIKVLADDRKGRRHQKFILKIPSGHTLLVAHNIDLAPRIKGLRKGDRVAFFGEYEWTPKGGVVHWTHHDPDGRHAGGWLRHAGIVYQ